MDFTTKIYNLKDPFNIYNAITIKWYFLYICIIFLGIIWIRVVICDDGNFYCIQCSNTKSIYKVLQPFFTPNHKELKYCVSLSVIPCYFLHNIFTNFKIIAILHWNNEKNILRVPQTMLQQYLHYFPYHNFNISEWERKTNYIKYCLHMR